MWIRFFSDDIDLQHILVVEKIFRGLPMDEIGGFTSKKTSFLAFHLYEIGSSGVPVSEMVVVLVSPFMKAVFLESMSAEQTSGNFSLTISFWSFWNHLNWFPWIFLNQNNSHGIFHHETDFQKNLQNKLIAWFSHQHILFSRSCKKIKTLFFSIFQSWKELSLNSRCWSSFFWLFLRRNQFPWFFCDWSPLWWISLEWKKFLLFSKMKLISMDFQINFFFSWSHHCG